MPGSLRHRDGELEFVTAMSTARCRLPAEGASDELVTWVSDLLAEGPAAGCPDDPWWRRCLAAFAGSEFVADARRRHGVVLRAG